MRGKVLGCLLLVALGLTACQAARDEASSGLYLGGAAGTTFRSTR
ncbi:hypothetical protein ACFFGY_07100 [Roseomonas elaeocarpi]|uniref:Argininosuccinate lyase n=1 Tax=Roseomonas elaeocarpi TaxID=907779 RepID=A0ABV6JTU7_9PROT